MKQPSLNLSSMTLVKLLPGVNKTIEINPLLCASFNADFDGDEMNIYEIKEDKDDLKNKLSLEPIKTQDYVLGDLRELTFEGLTAKVEGILFMIKNKSKGSQFNYDHTYKKLGKIIVNNKVLIDINECYVDGLSDDNWFEGCKTAIESASSISFNISGYLAYICNQAYL
ncbi:uncharacterized protein KQ657_002050 [Scheffersomyces spartinae]|uniref:RNA polymerase alpha subunit domain-containing protein n=1 Tax=Scheffersomyces spartinae TaxID=45513 RepID=A0A9P7V6Y1_9ASCO|nr:uncharacterized protein KQ657_002050 [Scheffersomyces spartinae]KAG7192331.1 hypothetical protein KQ657_002050 [Scheffersomyces spartinae]